MLVVYYTRTGNTGKMAKAIAEGAESAGAEAVLKSVYSVKNEDILEADAIIAGSPTQNKRVPSKMMAFINDMKDLELDGKIGAAFGSYGWSGEAVGILNDELEKLGIKLVSKGIRVRREPGEADLRDLKELGRKVAEVAG
ncbi:MAG: lactamase [Candidatus Syntrophoarchaeum butanivorans]|uniref:Lactamase n=1 Tax=Candidatus Syntropharchaeum butanivorans TaxID=1839936 RepID=A0A1F2P7G8_9EURY|nr:MAG: lactamase [Candidatus Syntrophoarchaeum butanivorans]